MKRKRVFLSKNLLNNIKITTLNEKELKNNRKKLFILNTELKITYPIY